MSGNSNSFSRTSAKETFNPADNFRGQPRPEHHIHRESEALPNNDSMAYGQDQSKDTPWENRRDTGTSPTFRHSSSYVLCTPFRNNVWTDYGVFHLLGVTGNRQGTPDFQDSSFSQNAFNSERPLNVKPTNQGGVAVDGRGDLPEGHANMADKMIGKMQKVRNLLTRCFPMF